MGQTKSYQSKFQDELKNVGVSGVNSKYPSEFEYYLMALELVDSRGWTEEYFVFPVMPSQMSKVENNRTTIKKSASGVTVLYSDSPTPNDLTIKGNFGKGFKMISRSDRSQPKYGYGYNFGSFSKKTPEFDSSVKTGYGATKILQRIVNKSGNLDGNGEPRRLFLYNMALGESYLCVVPNGGLTLSQDYDKNMIWEYSLNLSLIANMEDLLPSKKGSSASDLMSTASVKAGISSEISKVIKLKKDLKINGVRSTLGKFAKITKYNMEKFLDMYKKFVDTYLWAITNYYKGESIVKDAFTYIDYMVVEMKMIDGLWEMYANVFINEGHWELLDVYENIKLRVQTTINLARWMRCSRLDVYSQSTVAVHIQKQGESIEKVIQNFGSIDKENDWANLAIQNDLNEENYSSIGGVVFQVKLLNASNFELRNVVDIMNPTSMYGKDMKKKMELSSGDIVTLQGFDALLQTFDTILLTEKGSIPEFPEDGQENDLVGSNTNVFNYPSIFRNFMNIFQKDERFSEFELIDFVKQEDKVFMKIQVKTKVGKSLQQNILV